MHSKQTVKNCCEEDNMMISNEKIVTCCQTNNTLST